jgi:glycolate oxidase
MIATATDSLISDLRALLGEANVLWRAYDLALYEYDASSLTRSRPEAVVLPRSTADVSAVMRLCYERGVPCTPRGAGTGLSGGAIACDGGVVLSFARMNRILSIDPDNRCAVVEPGVVNLHLSNATRPYGLYYVPDPSSQRVCTVGGNVGENSGGAHTLLHGVTVNHVLALEVVLPGGEIITMGALAEDTPGYDLTGLLVGAEGTLGAVTKATVRLTPLPEATRTMLAVFATPHQASAAVSAIVAHGTVPAALEMLDQAAIEAVELAYHAGYPTDAGAVLLIEVEGVVEGLDELAEEIRALCRAQGAREVRLARDAAESVRLWAGRKGAFAAMGRLSPDYYTMDGVIPRSRLPDVLDTVGTIARRYGVRIPNVFHAGDGNLHPLILFDAADAAQAARVHEAAAEILRVCAAAGGALTGEHGVGLEKNTLMDLTFTPDDLDLMARVRSAIDPKGLCNPGKILPTPGRCAREAGRARASAGW